MYQHQPDRSLGNQPSATPPAPDLISGSIPQHPEHDSRRGNKLFVAGVAGVIGLGAVAAWAGFSGGESAPNTSPVPSASAKPFTPTPETTTVAASPSTTESALPSSTPSTTEAAVVPTTDPITRLQAAANVLDNDGCYVSGTTNDGIVAGKNGEQFVRLNVDVVNGIDQASDVAGIIQKIGVIGIVYGTDGKSTGQVLTNAKPSGWPGLTKLLVPAKTAPDTNVQFAVVGEAIDQQTGQTATNTWVCNGPGARRAYQGNGTFTEPDVPFGGLTGQDDQFSSQSGQVYPDANFVKLG
ncbi:MAG TPA: hypothetical protein VIR03_03470 [Candidatus Saccharimonadales bacterium]